jgi:hypothetical protein
LIVFWDLERRGDDVEALRGLSIKNFEGVRTVGLNMCPRAPGEREVAGEAWRSLNIGVALVIAHVEISS